MFNTSNGGYSLSDIAAITGHNNNNDGFGSGNGAWLIIILFLFCFMGWGDGNGFGNRSNNGGGIPMVSPASYQGTTTREEISYGFDMNGLENGIRGIQNGLCDGFYAQNSALMSGLSGVNSNITNLGYQTQQGFNDASTALLNATHNQTIAEMQDTNALSTQLSTCCCTTQSNLKDIAYQMATDTCSINTNGSNNTRDIIDSQTANTRAILEAIQQNKVDAMQDKINTLTAQNNQLAFQASQQAQNAYLLNRLQPSPVPAYTVASPLATYYTGCAGCSSVA